MTRSHRFFTAAVVGLALGLSGLAVGVRAEPPGQPVPVTLFGHFSGQHDEPSQTEAGWRSSQADRQALKRQQDPSVVLPLHRRPQMIQRTQSALAELGYDPGPADGKMGPRTRAAIRAFQSDRQQTADGRLTHRLLGQLATALAEARHRETRPTLPPPVPVVEIPTSEAAATDAVITEDSAPSGTREATAKVQEESFALIATAEAASLTRNAMNDGRSDYSLGEAARDAWFITRGVSTYLVGLIGQEIAGAVD